MPQIYTPEGLLDPTVHLTAGQAAELCGISEDTIRRARKRDLLPGAFQDQSDSYHRWWMPIGDLLTAGLLKRTDVAGHHEPPVLSLVSVPVPAPAANAGPISGKLTASCCNVRAVRTAGFTPVYTAILAASAAA